LNEAATDILAAGTRAELRVDDVLSPYWGVFVVAFVVAFMITPAVRWLALRNGVVDWPDKARKAHAQPVAYLGGVAIFLGWLAGVFACLFCTPHSQLVEGGPAGHVSFPISILIGATVITIIGLVDDVYGISPRVKVGGQLLAAAALASQDVGIRLVQGLFDAAGIGVPHWLVYSLGAVTIAIFVVGACNAVNLLDGLDGLATGVTSIASLGFLVIAVVVALRASTSPQQMIAEQLADPVRVVMCLAVLGALLGYLPYNFNPATIFMGDTGSLLLGFLSVTTIMLFAHADDGPLLVMAALMVFALPITDTTLAIVRRKMSGQPVFSADSNHLHHQLLRFTTSLNVGPALNVKLAVLALYGLSGMFALLGVSMVFLRWRYVMAAFMVVFGFVIVTAYKAGQRHALAQQLKEMGYADDAGPKPTDAATPEPDTTPAPTDSSPHVLVQDAGQAVQRRRSA
jgi:UDP-GlcNAc:undecaprenyl-phosphate/decaprenyl-phosphate GlcNAc-1-phosphate transferase